MGLNTMPNTFSRTRDPDKMRVGDVVWHKEGHLLILLKKVGEPRKFKRLRVYDWRKGQYWSELLLKRDILEIPRLTLFITKKRAETLIKDSFQTSEVITSLKPGQTEGYLKVIKKAGKRYRKALRDGLTP